MKFLRKLISVLLIVVLKLFSESFNSLVKWIKKFIGFSLFAKELIEIVLYSKFIGEETKLIPNPMIKYFMIYSEAGASVVDSAGASPPSAVESESSSSSSESSSMAPLDVLTPTITELSGAKNSHPSTETSLI